jgi:hypothetical protein
MNLMSDRCLEISRTREFLDRPIRSRFFAVVVGPGENAKLVQRNQVTMRARQAAILYINLQFSPIRRTIMPTYIWTL